MSKEWHGEYWRGYDHTIKGWVHKFLVDRINPQGATRRVRVNDVIERHAVIKVKDSPHIGTSSIIHDNDEFVVWITNGKKLYQMLEQPLEHDQGWFVSYVGRNAMFGGGSKHATLDEAVAAFDDYCGYAPEQLSLI